MNGPEHCRQRGKPVFEMIRYPAQLIKIFSVDGGAEQMGPSRLLHPGEKILDRIFMQFLFQLLPVASEAAVLFQHFRQFPGELLRRGLQLESQGIDQGAILGGPTVGFEPRAGLDTAQPRADPFLGDNSKGADLARRRHMGPAAELLL